MPDITDYMPGTDAGRNDLLRFAGRLRPALASHRGDVEVRGALEKIKR